MRNITKFMLLFIAAIILSIMIFPASADDNINRSLNVSVAEIDLGIESLTLEVGETYTFDIRFKPENPLSPWLVWFPSDSSLVTIDQNKNTVTAKAPGSVRILVETFDGNAAAVCSITINGRESKDAYNMKSGEYYIHLSKEDREKITAKTIIRYLDFLGESTFTEKAYNNASQRWFNAAARVVPGTEKAESERAYALGMADAEPLLNLNTVTLVGSFEQIIAFVSGNENLLEVFELDPKIIIDPVTEEFSSENVRKAMNLGGNTETLTSISTAHDLGYNGNGVNIAIIDTGLDSSHEQFSGRVIAEKCFSTNYIESTDGTGRIVLSVCAQNTTTANSAAPSGAEHKEKFDHGSHVAGIAAGRDGIAPKAGIIAVQAFSEVWNGSEYIGSTMYTSDELKAYNYLVDLVSNGTKITAVNMSYGSTNTTWPDICDNSSSTVFNGIQSMVNAGIIPVVSAGNNYQNDQMTRPACLSNTFAVSALADLSDPLIAPFSNHSELVDMAAPGTNIYSASYPSGYIKKNGTSMATPMVTGAIAIAKQAYPYNKPSDYRLFLKSISGKSVNRRSTGNASDTGSGKTFSYNTTVLDFSDFSNYVMTALTVPADQVLGLDKKITVTVKTDRTATGYTIDVYDITNKISVSPTLTTSESGSNTVFTLSGSLVNGHLYRLNISKYKNIGGVKFLSSTQTRYAMPSLKPKNLTAQPLSRGASLRAENKTPNSRMAFLVYEAATDKLVKSVFPSGTKTAGTAKGLKKGKRYYVVSKSYKEYGGKKYWGQESPRVYFVPLTMPAKVKLTWKNNTTAAISASAVKAATGIRVLYRVPGGKLKNGCISAARSFTCSISGLDKSKSYEFYVLKYKTINSQKYYSAGVVIRHKSESSGLPAPKNIVMNAPEGKKPTFTITKYAGATGISVLYKIGDGNFRKGCQAAKNTCTFKVKLKTDELSNYTFYVMQYKKSSAGKRIYSPGVTIYNSLGPK